MMYRLKSSVRWDKNGDACALKKYGPQPVLPVINPAFDIVAEGV